MDPSQLGQIQNYIRSAAIRGRQIERVGPFLATFDPHTELKYLSYAIPDDGANPTAKDVQSLIEAYIQRERIPRLEYIPDLSPNILAKLLEAGFKSEGELPLMTCRPDQLVSQPLPPGIEFIRAKSGEELMGCLAAQNESYDAPPANDDDLARFRDSVASGTIAVIARSAETNRTVAGGICTAPANGITEIAGVGTIAAFRRKGIDDALTERLVLEAIKEKADLCFLTAQEAESNMYRRVGFQTICTILHISREL